MKNTMNNIKLTIMKFLQTVSMAVAKFYNYLPKPIRIGLMIFTSTLLAAWTKLLIGDIQSLDGLNKYIQAIADAIVPFLTVVYNLIQEYVREKGTETLAASGDTSTIEQLVTKVNDTQDIIDNAK